MKNRSMQVFTLLVLLVLSALLLAACGTAQAAIPASKRTITMTAVEPKGGVTVDKEAFPKGKLPEGGGYVLKSPDNTGRWEISTYRWDPNQITVFQGDEVTLEIIGINGEAHPTIVEGYGLSFAVKRGEVTTVKFKADKVGVFKFQCTAHQPTMVGELIVLPRS